MSSGNLSRRTNEPVGKTSGSISADGSTIYYHADTEGPGSETGSFFAVPWSGGAAVDLTPDLPPCATSGTAEAKDGSVLALLTASGGAAEVWVLAPPWAPAGGSVPRLLARVEETLRRDSIAMSPDGSLLAITSNEPSLRTGTVSLDQSLIVYNTTTGAVVAELSDPRGSLSVPHWSPGGDKELMAFSDSSGFARPFLWSPTDPGSSAQPLPGLDALQGELTLVAWDKAHPAIFKQTHAAEEALWRYDLADGAAVKLSETPPAAVWGGGGFFGIGSHSDELVLQMQDAATPPRFVAVDPLTGAVGRTILAVGDGSRLPPGRPFTSVLLPNGGNGETVQAWVSVPDGEGPWPTIVHTHGGPTSCQMAIFQPEAQAWLDLGFAYMTINYHGSTGFGKAWESSIYGQLGVLEVDDMAVGVAYLLEHNIAIEKEIFLTGRSYGGYLTLQVAGRRPELWAGGMGVVAIADWALMYEDQADTLRGYQRALFRGAPNETPEATAIASPISYAEAVTAPLLVQQGANDTRCPRRQMEGERALTRVLTVFMFLSAFSLPNASVAPQPTPVLWTGMARTFDWSGSTPATAAMISR
eukprot:COSAG02_NODE_5357_length_4400_cov_34.252964_3_plen_585_part_00